MSLPFCYPSAMKNPLPRLAPAILLLCAALTLSAPASAQDWAKSILDKSPRHQEWVKVKYGSRTVDAFVVYPEVSHKAPVVLLIHEIFGLSDWARSMADDSPPWATSSSHPTCFRATAPTAEAPARSLTSNPSSRPSPASTPAPSPPTSTPPPTTR